MQTLNDIASSLGVSLQTVYNRKADAEQRLGRKIEGSPHPSDKRKIVYDADAVALITGCPVEPAAQPVEVTVETGNHCQALVKPSMEGTQFSLERFRADDVEALIFENPDLVADEFLAVADQLVGAMDADVKAREERLKRSREAQQKVADKARELQLEQRLYGPKVAKLGFRATYQPIPYTARFMSSTLAGLKMN